MKNKILSAILAAIMIVSGVPTAAADVIEIIPLIPPPPPPNCDACRRTVLFCECITEYCTVCGDCDPFMFIGWNGRRDYCRNLTSCEILRSSWGSTDISAYMPLFRELPKLNHLTIVGNNRPLDISSLSELTNLTHLYLNNNRITDISPLSELTNLTHLDLANNRITDISPLSGLTNLEHLDLSGIINIANRDTNEISDISPLSGLTNLTELSLSNNYISDVSPLSELTSLTELNLVSNQISDLSPLGELPNLERLILNANQISDLLPLSELTTLTELRLWGNQISDLSPLSRLMSLSVLCVRNNPPLTLAHVNEFRASRWVRTFEHNATCNGCCRACDDCKQDPCDCPEPPPPPVLVCTSDDPCKSCPLESCGYLGGRFEFGRVTNNPEGLVVQDAIAILRYLVELPSVVATCPDARAAAAIVNPESGEIVVQDAIAILRRLVELPSALDER